MSTSFIEAQALWEQIYNPYDTGNNLPNAGNIVYNEMGPTPENARDINDANRYSPWHTEIVTLRCPSDPGIGTPAQGRTNYAACLGDSPFRGASGPKDAGLCTPSDAGQWSRASMRGAFVPGQKAKFRDILDGLANTVIAGLLQKTTFSFEPLTWKTNRTSCPAHGAISRRTSRHAATSARSSIWTS